MEETAKPDGGPPPISWALGRKSGSPFPWEVGGGAGARALSLAQSRRKPAGERSLQKGL